MQYPRRGKVRARGGGPKPPASPTDPRLIAIGEIMGTHGVHGELRVKLYNPDSELLFDVAGVYLRKGVDAPRWHELEQVRPGGKGLIAQLSEVATPELAKALYGCELCVERADLPPLAPGEFYHCDVEGLPARSPDGAAQGTIERVVEYPAAAVLRLRAARGVLEVPMREPYLLAVDLEAGQVLVDRLDDLEPDPPPKAHVRRDRKS